LDEALQVIEKLKLKHGDAKLSKNVIVFKLLGTKNTLSFRDTVRSTQKEILTNEKTSWHSVLLRMFLSKLFLQFDAFHSALIEIEAVLATLDGGKYKVIP